MTIIAEPESAATAPAYVLRRVADILDGLPHARVSPPDVYRALTDATPVGDLRGEEAYEVYVRRAAACRALAAHLFATGGDRWLDRWTGPRGRDEFAATVRAAADAALAAVNGETPAGVTA